MMEEEDDVLFDQERLLGPKDDAAREKRDRKRRIVKTATLSMSFFCLGLCISIPGPTLLDLGRRVNKDTEHMTFIFTARSIGYLIGSLAGGILFDFFDQQILLFYIIATTAVATVGIPWCTALITLSALICMQGVALGVLDTGGNVFCIKIWGQKSAPFMQALHFAFGIGAFLAPLLARPFLLDTTVLTYNSTNADYYPVNFKVPSLGSLTAGNSRFARDVPNLQFSDLNPDYQTSFSIRHLKPRDGRWLSNITAGYYVNNFVVPDSYRPQKSSHSDGVGLREVYEGSAVISDKIQGYEHNNDIAVQKHFYTTDLIGEKRLQAPLKSILVSSSNGVTKEHGHSHDVGLRQKYFRKESFESVAEVNDGGLRNTGVINVNHQIENVNVLRLKREENRLTDHENVTGAGNDTQLFSNETQQNQTSTVPLPATVTMKPRKPGFNDGEDLSKEHADSSVINSQLMDIKKNKNPPQNIPAPAIASTAASSTGVYGTGSTLLKNSGELLAQNLTDTNVSTAYSNEAAATRTLAAAAVTSSTVQKSVFNGDAANDTVLLDVSGTQVISTVSSSTAHQNMENSKELQDKETENLIKTGVSSTFSAEVGTSLPTVAASLPTAATSLPTTAANMPTVVTSVPTVTTILPTVATSLPTSAVTMSTSATGVSTSTDLTAAVWLTASSAPESPPKTDTSNSTEVTSKQSEAVDDVSSSNFSTNTTVNTRSHESDGDFSEGMFAVLAGMSKIQIAYSFIGILLVVNASLFLLLYCRDRLLPLPLSARSHEELTRPPDTKCFIASLLVLLFFFFFAYVGMEVTYGGLLTTFAVDYPKDVWTPAQAATLTALFWGCLALGRCFAIFVAHSFKPPCMMVTNLCLTIAGALLLSFGVQVSSAVLWAGTVILGLGMSSVFPTAISWTNSYFPLTGRATSVFVAGSGIGEMAIPLLTGYLYERVDRMSLMYMTLTLSVLLTLLYVSLQMLVCQKSRSSPRRSHSGFMRLNNSEDMADALDMDTIEVVEGEATDTETMVKRGVKRSEDSRKKQNGEGYMSAELTRLVELSD